MGSWIEVVAYWRVARPASFTVGRDEQRRGRVVVTSVFLPESG
jgi:hypothetical protein